MKSLRVRPLLAQWEWQARASCRGMDSSVFFPPSETRGQERRDRETIARSVCHACPVRQQCASFAVRTGQAHGIWGGLTETDRLSSRSRRSA